MDTTSPFSADLLDQNNFPEQAAERYNPLKDRVYIAGLCMLALSIIVFVTGISAPPRNFLDGSFLIHYLLVWL